ncbi:PREDICTED: hydroxysteroid 11-beta-dehydrogenase 1-like protein isoform X8 [Cercocebus atys]|nr:PREDICTED: hydroxysteroid 11-beta-dehydrogenase 1-like protein isoform X8 [Cercocebus atys]XP_011928568.1 PREDICTED: hydroxysteroid 11-beta-dehydrogenase 1-like protein isoform X8 [Cercocebus atys]XP_011928570.1 PREDICTED: hydroxysteroid 11-beta-dehydrogenase 1-like protein isoform X8 [Cercocebus atys]XP_011928571.1 PREDICTED: hydroxysteroid 11-beta-dehydrogenase 1-like protein isoform X8 [Cercocebus atys]XP_011928572.1 PREDICTED: hydroxysteroid 11-beta-dehydrogenase 1-like protein isoform X
MKVLLLTGLGALFFAYYWDDNFDPASLQGARVLLTGASAGVGEELAYHYARLGSHLVLTAHTEALLQKVVGNCRKLGAPKVFYIAADMASPEAPESVVQFALDKLGGLDYLVLNHIGGVPAGTRARTPQATRWLMQAPPLPVTRECHLQVNFLSYVQLTSRALPSLTDSKGSLVVVSSLLGACTRPRLCGTGSGELDAAAKFALDSFFGSLRRELDVQDVNVAITMCVLGLRDRASAAEAVRGVTRVKAAPGPKAALAVIRGGATRAAGVFYPWRFHLLCLLRRWLPRPRAWFIRQDLNVTAAAAA